MALAPSGGTGCPVEDAFLARICTNLENRPTDNATFLSVHKRLPQAPSIIVREASEDSAQASRPAANKSGSAFV